MSLKKPIYVLTPTVYSELQKDYQSAKINAVLRHALSKTAVDSVVFNNDTPAAVKPVYSIDLKTMKVANQRQSGRCWIFSALNLLREIIGKKANIEQFELSQNYIGFYDKLEKFNFLLSELEKNIAADHDERLNHKLLGDGVGDGGQWDMFAAVVRKYGICPKSAYEETFQAYTTAGTNKLINAAARKFAAEIHHLHDNGRDDEIGLLHEEYVKKVYDLLCSSYGVPPERFDFEYRDKDGNYHCEKAYSPLSFFNKYIGKEIDDYVSLIHAPTQNKEYGKVYTVDHLGNVVEAGSVRHLNLPLERIKELIIATLKENEPVWFGSDVANYGDRSAGIWDDGSFDYVSAFGLDLSFDKADMLDYYQSAMNHAMLITGVSFDDNGKPVKWKIENSWGEDRGEKGYFIQTDSWFIKFCYQAVVNKKYLNAAEKTSLKQEAVHLPLWDPFGTLAD